MQGVVILLTDSVYLYVYNSQSDIHLVVLSFESLSYICKHVKRFYLEDNIFDV